MMRFNFFILSLLLSFSLYSQEQYQQYFTDQSLRIDYILTVNNDTTIAVVQQIKQEPYWAGTRKHLIDPFGYGDYRISVFDTAGRLIYSNGYSSLSSEWRRKSDGRFLLFYESVNIPMPKQKIRFVLSLRDKQLRLHTLIDTLIAPDSKFISTEEVEQYPVKNLLINGAPEDKVDLVVIPEGYTKSEMRLFIKHARRLMDTLFTYEPFSEYKDRFNIRLVLAPSAESGCDIPQDGVWRNTLLDAHFYTFDIPRYLTIDNYKRVKDIASLVPYDQIVVLVNTDEYGGGGFYNFINLTAASNPYAPLIFVHEFGHAFGGLADEYVDYENLDFYSKEVEPWEPNITTLISFESKWKDMVPDTVPIPTPMKPEYSEVVGVFEGAGYSPYGIYRPQQRCMMRSLSARFCKVCQRAILRIIKYYTE